MTRDEAIAIRSRQLSGGAVSADQAREAEELQRQTQRPVVWGKSREVLERLERGPVKRDNFFAEAKALCGSSAWTAISRLEERGLIACEVRLTDKGALALGGKQGGQS